MITLNAVGDILLADKVGEKIALNGADYLFHNVCHIFSEAEFNIGNLECPLSDRGEVYTHKEYLFRASPDCAKSLKDAGFNILCLANNHIMDYGPLALYDTMSILEKHGISYVGAGKNLEEACRPLIYELKGLKIAFLAFTYAYSAKKRRPGCCPCDLNFIQKQIKSVKCTVDLVVVSIHKGIEYIDYPDRHTMALFRGAVDAGANLVLGHHPHVVQGLEIYSNALICYSLGNFITPHADEAVREKTYKTTALAYFTNHPPEVDDLRTIETFILQCKLDAKGIIDYKLIPVKSKEDFQLIMMHGYESQTFLERVKEISKKISQRDDAIFDELDFLLKKSKIYNLQKMRLKDIILNIFYLRPRHFKLLIPLLKAKLSKRLF
jgi:Bacterial capsule synthesis protein PGA_cap